MRYRRRPTSTAPIEPISEGATVELGPLGTGRVAHVAQRNWSRVARVEVGDDAYFVKQFIDRVGRWHRRGFEGDRQTADTLGEELAGVAVLRPLVRDEDRLFMVFPFVEMTTIDSMNGGRAGDGDAAARVGEAMAAILRDRGAVGDPETVHVWKGLDPKNVGWSGDGRLWVFDFGPLVQMERRDAAALVVAAGLLSRWVARPGVHLVAPERPIIRGVCEPVAPMTSLDLVQEALHHHKELRRREPQRRGLAATATQVGLRTLGNVHWRSVNKEAERLFR